MTHNAALLAVVDVAPAHDVAADVLFGPAFHLCLEDGVTFGLSALLQTLGDPLVLVVGLEVLAQGDAAALGIADFAVLNDPALGPVGAHHAFLIGGGRSPGGSCLAYHEPGQGDVPDAGATGVEAVAADVDLHQMLSGVRALEVSVDQGVAALLAGVPLIQAGFRLLAGSEHFGIQHSFQAVHFVQALAVQIHFAGVQRHLGIVPVAGKQGGVGVVVVEQTVADSSHVHVALVFLPFLYRLRAGDHCAQGLLGPVGDPGVFTAAVQRVHIFPIKTGRHHHFVAGTSQLGGFVDGLEGGLFGAASAAERAG